MSMTAPQLTSHLRLEDYDSLVSVIDWGALWTWSIFDGNDARLETVAELKRRLRLRECAFALVSAGAAEEDWTEITSMAYEAADELSSMAEGLRRAGRDVARVDYYEAEAMRAQRILEALGHYVED
jgi:hypothetical protein